MKIKVKRISSWRGLMFRRKPKFPVLLETDGVSTIHTWFVFFSIDVVWLSKDFEVLHVKRDLKPFSYYNPQIRAGYVLEFPTGTICMNTGQKVEVA